MCKSLNKTTGSILVSGASGIVGYGILNNLKSLNYYFVGTTIYDESPANCFSDIVEIVPKAKDDIYIEVLLNLIKKHNIILMFPGIEDDMISWNRYRDEIEETGAIPILNNPKLISMCIDKWCFYEMMVKSDVSCRINTSLDVNFKEWDFPFVVKPRRGYGSKGVSIVYSKQEFECYKNRVGSELMIQEYIGSDNDEYTVSAFFDKESKFRAGIALKRKLSNLGYTEIAETVDLSQFLSVIEELSVLFKPIGPTNFQFRRKGNDWKLLEINPRISSSTSIRAGFGYNECQMAVDYFINKEIISQPNIKKGKAIRYVGDYFIYDDSNYI